MSKPDIVELFGVCISAFVAFLTARGYFTKQSELASEHLATQKARESLVDLKIKNIELELKEHKLVIAKLQAQDTELAKLSTKIDLLASDVTELKEVYQSKRF